MSKSRDLESHMDELGDRARRYANDAGDRARRYAHDAGDTARDWISRGRNAAARFDSDGYRRRIARMAEDLADETSYRYRRVKRQVNRHPVATVAIVAGAVGAFLLLRRALRGSDED